MQCCELYQWWSTDQNSIDEISWFVLWKLRSVWNENIDCHCMQLELNWSLIQLNLMGCKLVEQIQKGNFLYLSTWEWDKQILVFGTIQVMT